MTTVPSLTERDVEARVGARNLELGREYVEDKAIIEPRLQGTTLKARCAGMSGGPYRVRATLSERGITDAYCSCPVGAEGTCKHVAALVLDWLAHPHTFTALQETDTSLEARSKAELITLIKQMLRQEPDLEILLETPLPGSSKRRQPVNPEIYRRQAAAVFRGSDYEYGAEADISARLLAITEIGDEFAEQGEYANAAAVYAAVSAEVLESYGEYGDEGGELGDVVTTCVEGLALGLEHETDEDARETILRALFDIYRFDVDYGGVGLSDGVPDSVLSLATPEERALLATWVREALPSGDDFSSNFARQEYGALLLQLMADNLDDEAYIRICRETGRTNDLVDRLLSLGRIDEAVAAAEQTQDYALLQLAPVFVEHGQAVLAERLIAARAATSEDYRLAEWLMQQHRLAGDAAGALDWGLRVFRKQPFLERYREVRELAHAMGTWEAVRPQLMEILQQHPSTLIQVYLDEGEIDAALAALPTLATAYAVHYYDNALHLQVARAAEETRPQAAIEIYKQYAERLIAQQGRDNYQRAAQLLTRVRELDRGLHQEDAWKRYIDELRERNRRLRALKEELTAAGL